MKIPQAFRSLCCLFTIWATAGSLPVTAQELDFVLTPQATGLDVERTLGLKRGPAAAEQNSAKLNAALNNPAYNSGHTFYFPAGDWYFGVDTQNRDVSGTCVQTPIKSGYRFVGNGIRRAWNTGNQFEGLSTQIIYAGPRVSLEKLKVSIAGASDTISILSGYQVKPQDMGATVEITGGANAIPGFYTIAAADPAAGTWTLDRACSTGRVNSIEGLMTYSLWKDRSLGSVYQGMNLVGNPKYGGTRCHVGLHVESKVHNLNTGKIRFSDASCSDFNAVIMAGRSMASAYRMAKVRPFSDIGYGVGRDYPGANDNHADNLFLTNVYAVECRTLFYARNSHSVAHRLEFIRAVNVDEVAYCERNAKISLEDIHMGGRRKRILRLGQFAVNSGLATIRHVHLDGTAQIGKIVQMDGTPSPGLGSTTPVAKDGTRGRIVIDAVHIPQGMNAWNEPLIDVYGAVRITIENWEGRMLPGTVLLCAHPDDPNYKPHCTIENCCLAVQSAQEEVIREPESSPGIHCLFRGNSNYNNSISYPTNDRYVTP